MEPMGTADEPETGTGIHVSRFRVSNIGVEGGIA